MATVHLVDGLDEVSRKIVVITILTLAEYKSFKNYLVLLLFDG